METPITVKDPVCGMDIVPNLRRGWDYLFEGIWYHFCGSECRHKFQTNPLSFLRPKSAGPIAASAPQRRPTSRSFLNRLKSWFR